MQAIGACLTVLVVLVVRMRVETVRNAKKADKERDKAVSG